MEHPPAHLPDYLPSGTGIYFEARGPNGSELYFSDGTAAGTTLVCDIYPTALSGNPETLVLCDGDLFFNADDSVVGEELRRLRRPGAYVVDLGLSGNGSQLSSTHPVLGSVATISIKGTPGGSIGLLVTSAPTAGPTTLLTSPGSVSWIDLATFYVLKIYLTPDLTVNQPIPANASLLGAKAHLQGWAIPPAGLPASTSNGLQLVFGS